LIAAGSDHGITAIGSEANHVLRIEKGYITTGYEVDGLTTPYDLGMGWIVGKKKADFIGARSLRVHHALDEAGAADAKHAGGRAELVGLLTEDPSIVMPEGAPVVTTDTAPGGQSGVKIDGHVAASVYSATLGHSIALALVRNGHSRREERILVQVGAEKLSAQIVAPAFYDTDGDRLRS
jgi:sarcosine oxidase subunit alpha